MGLTMKEKQALTREVCVRYRSCKKKDKTIILDEFVKTTGYNRKYALQLLLNYGKTKLRKINGKWVKVTFNTPEKQRKKRQGKRIYNDEVIKCLSGIWGFFGFMCGKLLAPFMREQMRYLEEWKDFGITGEIKEKLLRISPSTIDLRLRAEKQKLKIKGKSGTRPGKLLRKNIPIRTYYAWDEKKPGFFEIDTVHHCGDRDSGEFNLTLTAVDVATGWVQLFALLNKAHKWTLDSLKLLPSILPFPLLGIDSDNGSEFINKDTVAWCDKNHIQFTRSRSYHKNDNCYVEQKNDTCVRQYVGYRRYDTFAERDALALVYKHLCPLLNYFLPTMKLISKTRIGSHVKKVYDKNPKSPYQRLLESHDISKEQKQNLIDICNSFNPVILKKQVDSAITYLVSVYDRKALPPSAHK